MASIMKMHSLRVGAIGLLFLAAASSLFAQSDDEAAAPLGSAPGAPAGSHALSDLDRVNLFNGNLSFRLQLLAIGGRGEANHTVALTIEQRWSAKEGPQFGILRPRFNWWRWIRPGYGPGVLRVRRFSARTLMTFTTSDQTQYELRDVLYDGGPSPDGNRGKTFKTYDGTAVTFESDTDLRDDGSGGTATGMLLFADGRQYRIEESLVRWLRDRNGNILRFDYTEPPAYHDPPWGLQVSQITDSLNRTVTFSYASETNPKDRITFLGFNGATRVIDVHYAPLQEALLEGTTQTIEDLFPNISWEGPWGTTVHNPKVVRSVVLPNSQSYSFLYNAHGELVRAVLPTGGTLAYSHEHAPTQDLPVYRRLRQKSTYDGATEVMRTTWDNDAPVGTTDQSVDVTHINPAGDAVLSWERHYFHGRASSQLSSGSAAFSPWRYGREYKVDVYAPSVTTPLRTVQHTWAQKAPVAWWTGSAADSPANDPRITSTVVSLDGQSVSQEVYTHDDYNNRTSVAEFDLSGPSPTTAFRIRETEYVTTDLATGVKYTSYPIHLRRLPKREAVLDANGEKRAETKYEYDTGTLAATPALTGRSSPDSHPASYKPRGNLTKISRWLNSTPAVDLVTTRTYDASGNLVSETDPRQNTTTYAFSDNFGSPNGEALTSAPPSELGGLQTHAFLTQVTNPKSHSTHTQYDYYMGQPVDVQDANGVVTSLWYSDSLDRITNVVRANNQPSVRSQTAYTYADSSRTVTTQRDQNGADLAHQSKVIYDSLGREVESRLFEDYQDANKYIVSSRAYDAMGQLYSVSNPYRLYVQPPEEPIWTTTGFDALGRLVSVTAPGSAITTTSYSGTETTVTDPAGKKRKSRTDSAGRLIQLTEDPNGLNYVTNYTYDVLDNVTQVTQAGGGTTQTRSFIYDSLSRLTSATNPESGTILYEAYDANGNLTRKRDARGTTTTIGYDELNRVVSRTYSDSTPDVTYTYDEPTVPYSKGRLVSVSAVSDSTPLSTTRFASFDPLGRVTSSTQTTNGQTYTMSYAYDRADRLVSETYPSGRVVSTTYDRAGRTTSVSEPKAGGTLIHAGSFSYLSYETKRRLGNGLWETAIFNNRLQPKRIRLGTSAGAFDLFELENGYGGTNNNGNVQLQFERLPGATLTVSYLHDGMNRLTSAIETSTRTGSSWSQTYDYDRWGNRAVTAGRVDMVHTPTSVTAFSATTNRLTALGYDNAGNLITDAAGRAFTYDAENRQKTAPGATYEYDGEGRRVKKVVSGSTTISVYDAFGKLVAEYATGALPGSRYITSDHLASTRVVTGPTGSLLARSDYYPFGEQIASNVGGRNEIDGYSSADESIRHKFASKQRDLENALDYSIARYLFPAHGRFTGADPLLGSADVGLPAAWNRYAYALNNPLTIVDPLGLWNWDASAGGTASDAELEQRTRDAKLSKKERSQAKQALIFRNVFRAALLTAAVGASSAQLPGSRRTAAQESIRAWGSEGDNNGVTVGSRPRQTGSRARVELMADDTISTKFNDDVRGEQLAVLIGHEGRHVADAQAWVTSHCVGCSLDLNHYWLEERGWNVASSMAEGLGLSNYGAGGSEYRVWDRGWSEADRDTLRAKGVAAILAKAYGFKPTDTNTFSSEPRRFPQE